MKGCTFFVLSAVIVVQFATYNVANPTAVQEFKDGNVIFSAKLYQEVALVQKSNFMVSPLSAELALALLEAGAVGQTAEEIRTGLHLPSTEAKIQEAVKELLPSLTKPKNYTFDIANKIYVQENATINSMFQDIAVNVYQAGVENIDFTKQQQAADKINHWVANQTNNKITDVVSSGDLQNAFSVIINTIYMNGNWSIQFDKKQTHNQIFYLSLNKTTQVKTMHQYDTRHKFKEDQELKAKLLQMDLLGDKASVTFVLPNCKNGLSGLEKQTDKILKIRDLAWENVDIALPAFTTKTEIEMTKILQKLGVKAAFNPLEVDLSNIAGKKGDLVVSKVIQKTFVDVTEGGIEAAAATAVIISNFSAVITDPKLFIADHPFMYFVRVNGVIVFVGRFVGPAQ